MASYITVDRKILKWEWYQDVKVFHLFLYFLLRANWEDGRWKGIDVKRGQLITGRLKLSKDTGLSEREIRTCLDKLKTTGEIAIKATSKYSIVTICKYNTYQNKFDKTDQHIGQQTVLPATNERPTSDQQTTTNNTLNNKEEESNNPMAVKSGIVFEMAVIFKKYYPIIQIEPEVHYPPCLQIAYRIAKLKGWEEKEVLNGKMKDTLTSWEKIVAFAKADSWLSTRSLIDFNDNKEWDRLVTKMSNAKNTDKKKENESSPIRKEKDTDFDKYKIKR